MEANTIAEIIGNIGFPIVMTIYLLRNFGTKIESLDLSIQNLSKSIESIKEQKD